MWLHEEENKHAATATATASLDVGTLMNEMYDKKPKIQWLLNYGRGNWLICSFLISIPITYSCMMLLLAVKK